MVVRTIQQKKITKRTTHKLILTPPKSVPRSVHASDHPEEARDICTHCGLAHDVLNRYKASVLHTHKRINAIVVSVPAKNKEGLKRALRRKGFRMEDSKRVFPMLNETIPSLEIPLIWNHGYDGKNVRCAILDTGIDHHPDFRGRIRMFRNFTSEGEEDHVGHGTHVAGIIGGAGKVFRGAAPEADLVIGKVLGMEGGDDTDVIAGLSWASRQNVQVINLSLGGPGSPDDALARECNALAKEGTLICVAAGNSGPARSTIGSPGNASGVITVGAVDKQKKLAEYSSRGPIPNKRYTKPDLVSFGGGVDFSASCVYKGGIISAKSRRMRNTTCDEKKRYTRMSGTSMATPHISGIAVLLLSALDQLASLWNQKQRAGFVKKLLRESVSLLMDEKLTRWDTGYGFPEPARAFQKIGEKFKTNSTKQPALFESSRVDGK